VSVPNSTNSSHFSFIKPYICSKILEQNKQAEGRYKEHNVTS